MDGDNRQNLETRIDEPHRIMLVVDDAPINRQLLSKIFSGTFEVLEAEDGIEALELLYQYGSSISIVILDIMMPRLDGFGVLEKIQDDPRFTDVPVVVITAYNDEDSQMRVLDLGAEDIISKPFSYQIVLHRIKNIVSRKENERSQERMRLAEQRLKQQEEFIYASEQDDKTGLYNKGAFCRHAKELMAKNPEKTYMLVRWDIDRFKVFNDIFGAAAGDKFLRWFGEQLSCYDTDESVVAHWHADHFVLCREYASLTDATLNFWLSTLAGYADSEGIDFDFVPRIGIYIIEDTSLDVTLMCDRAYLALRSTKNNYAERVAYYNESMRAVLLEEQEIIGELNTALASGQFAIYLQPQYNHADGKMVGAEVLVRWFHPEKGMRPPNRFIPVLEKHGLITKLDEFVWESACKLLRRWIDAGIEPVPLSVNISRIDVYSPRLCEFIISLIEKYRLDPKLLRLEITESAYIDDPSQLISVVNKLHEHGFIIEMDDFGSGYSSLNTLKDVPVDVLKLDMSFLGTRDTPDAGDAVDDSASKGGNILSSVVRMAHWLKLPVIAEGVETIHQADYLKSIGCLYMQGYHFARPMPVTDFEKMMRGEYEQDVFTDMYKGSDITGVTDFWNATAQATLLFNSFVGGAAIVELSGEHVEILRANDRFLEVLGTTRERYLAEQSHVLDRFFDESKEDYLNMLATAMKTGKEATCEVRSKPFTDGDPDIWTLCYTRFLAKNINSYIFYMTIENITSQKRLIEENEQLSERLNSIISSVPGGILEYQIADTVTIEYYNDALPAMFGFTGSEYNERFCRAPFLTVHPDDVVRVRETILREAKREVQQMRSIRFRHICSDGNYVWVEMTAHVVQKSESVITASAIILDISQQIEAEQRSVERDYEFEQQQMFIKSLYDTIPCGIIQFPISGSESIMISGNNTLWQMFGYADKADYVSCVGPGDAMRSVHPQDRKMASDNIAHVTKNGGRMDFMLRIICRDGTAKQVRTMLQKAKAMDGREAIQLVFSEIS